MPSGPCFQCGKTGHFASLCPDRLRYKAQQQEQRDQATAARSAPAPPPATPIRPRDDLGTILGMIRSIRSQLDAVEALLNQL